LIISPGSIPARLLFAGADEVVDAIRAEVAIEGTLMHQVVQVSKCFAEGKAQLMPVEGPSSQPTHTVAAWCPPQPAGWPTSHPILLWRMLSSVYGDTPYMAASHDFGIAPELLEVWIPNRASIKRRCEGDVVALFPSHTHGRG